MNSCWSAQRAAMVARPRGRSSIAQLPAGLRNSRCWRFTANRLSTSKCDSKTRARHRAHR
jgi:hypothetical protein